jgi:hypothetical protein
MFGSLLINQQISVKAKEKISMLFSIGFIKEINISMSSFERISIDIDVSKIFFCDANNVQEREIVGYCIYF